MQASIILLYYILAAVIFFTHLRLVCPFRDFQLCLIAPNKKWAREEEETLAMLSLSMGLLPD